VKSRRNTKIQHEYDTCMIIPTDSTCYEYLLGRWHPWGRQGSKGRNETWSSWYKKSNYWFANVDV